MTERQWNIILDRNINGGESLKNLCYEYGQSYTTGKRYRKRYLQQNT